MHKNLDHSGFWWVHVAATTVAVAGASSLPQLFKPWETGRPRQGKDHGACCVVGPLYSHCPWEVDSRV